MQQPLAAIEERRLLGILAPAGDSHVDGAEVALRRWGSQPARWPGPAAGHVVIRSAQRSKTLR